jgi:GNAT superfamily N-acetyltransferase
MIKMTDIIIRTELRSGDIGFITYMHGILYKKEYNYGVNFEAYVAQGLYEFYKNYNPQKDCIWIAEHNHKIIRSLLLMHREKEVAQLRYFLLDPDYRGIGLGKKLANFYTDFLNKKNYKKIYLWTTDELFAAAHIYKQMEFKLTQEIESTTFGKLLKEQRYDLIL